MPIRTHELPSSSAAFLFLAVVCSAAAAMIAAQTSPQGMPAHDAHQGVVVSADPYADPARSKEKFGKKHPQEAGILALEVGFRNDTEQPITVTLEHIRLAIEMPGFAPQNLEPLALDDAADRILGPQEPNPTAPRFPIPRRVPKGNRGKDWQKLRDTLKNAALRSDVLPPRSTIRGFLYFDLDHHFEWLEHSSLYIPELRFLPSREQLLYFEIELAPAVRP